MDALNIYVSQWHLVFAGDVLFSYRTLLLLTLTSVLKYYSGLVTECMASPSCALADFPQRTKSHFNIPT